MPERGVVVVPERPVGVGVLVLLGSSSGIDLGHSRLLAEHGAHAVTVEWFGGKNQAPGVCEIPLEVFARALDRLQQEGVDTLAVIGQSKGAEVAALLACIDDRVDLTVAISPSSVVWANVGAGVDGLSSPYRSSWTWHGEPLPFVSYDDSWSSPQSLGPISYRSLYEQSLLLDPEATAAAEIPVEEARGDMLLVAGFDDQLWPSARAAKTMAGRRLDRDGQVEVLQHDKAGHSPVFPGQPLPEPSRYLARGGTAEADAQLGATTWSSIVHRLGLHGAERPS